VCMEKLACRGSADAHASMPTWHCLYGEFCGRGRLGYFWKPLSESLHANVATVCCVHMQLISIRSVSKLVWVKCGFI